MTSLSNAYQLDVISDVIGKTQNFNNLKNLVLSCREMSTAFNLFMENIFVEYANDKVYLKDRDGDVNIVYLFTKKDNRWVPHFFRNLCTGPLPRQKQNTKKATEVFRKLLARDNYMILDLSKDHLYWMPRSSKLLASVSVSRFIIHTDQLRSFQTFIPRFDSVCVVRFNDFGIKDALELEEVCQSRDLQLTIWDPESHCQKIFTNALRDHAIAIKHVRNFHFVWRDYTCFDQNKNNVKAVISCIKMFSGFRKPNIENVTIIVSTHFSYEFFKYRPNYGTGTDFGIVLRNHYATILPYFYEIPERISANIRFSMNSDFKFGNEDPLVVFPQVFPSEDFELKYEGSEQESVLTITNRQTWLKDNVEFHFECTNVDKP